MELRKEFKIINAAEAAQDEAVLELDKEIAVKEVNLAPCLNSANTDNPKAGGISRKARAQHEEGVGFGAAHFRDMIYSRDMHACTCGGAHPGAQSPPSAHFRSLWPPPS